MIKLSKFCTGCGHYKKVDEFYDNLKNRDKKSAYCKVCDDKEEKKYIERKKSELSASTELPTDMTNEIKFIRLLRRLAKEGKYSISIKDSNPHGSGEKGTILIDWKKE